jgi:hypothetical protein
MMSSKQQRDSFEPLYPEDQDGFDKTVRRLAFALMAVSVIIFCVTNI